MSYADDLRADLEKRRAAALTGGARCSNCNDRTSFGNAMPGRIQRKLCSGCWAQHVSNPERKWERSNSRDNPSNVPNRPPRPNQTD